MGSSIEDLSHVRKLALIIDNGEYFRDENRLDQSSDHLGRLNGLLNEMKFQVTIRHKNVAKEIMRQIQEFTAKINNGDLIFFYFFGHGYQVNGKYYLLPTDDENIEEEDDIIEFGVDIERIFERLMDKKPWCMAVLILDCCRGYLLKNTLISNSMVQGTDLLRKPSPQRTFIQFTCAANETVKDHLFIEYLLQNIAQETVNVNFPDIFDITANDVRQERSGRKPLLSINGLPRLQPICLKRAITDPVKKAANRKLALIIVNENYRRSNNKLSGSIENAHRLCNQLKKINFQVMMEIDVTTNIMKVIQVFTDNINDGDLILVYFCGLSCHIEHKNYLLPVGDDRTETDINYEDNANDAQRILNRLIDKKPESTAVFILDCCSPYLLRNESTPDVTVRGNGLARMKAPSRTFVQFPCPANETVNDEWFIKYLLKYITQRNVKVNDLFRRIAKEIYLKRHKGQQPFYRNGLPDDEPVYLNRVSSLPIIPKQAIWNSDALTVVGGRGVGNTMDRVRCPKGLWVGKNQTVVVADSLNHRIMKYSQGYTDGEKIAGKNILGYRSDLLNEPTNVTFDAKSKSYIICDYHNRRVLRLSRRGKKHVKTIAENVCCFGLAIDDTGSIYVSDPERHEVRRYRKGKKYGTVVAGGHGQGSRLKQLNHPTYICIGDDHSVYVSDSWNDRVVRWDKDAKEGVIVAGSNGKGRDRNQLDCPAGILVDQLGRVYVADHQNFRVMRWHDGAKVGEVIAGGYFSRKSPKKMRGPFLSGNRPNELNGPEGLAFDQSGNLYVADSSNHRIQRFQIDVSS